MPELLYHHDAIVADFVRQLLGDDVDDFAEYRAIGVTHNGKIIAGVVYNHFYGRDIQASIASTTRKWANKAVLGAIFHYPYAQLACSRITAQTRGRNVQAQIFLRKLGFRQEGVMRQWYADDDAILFGQIKSECPWI